WKPNRQMILVLGAVYSAMLVVFIRWMTFFDFLSARLTYPAHLALVLLVMIGIQGGFQRLHKVFRAMLGGIVVFIAIVISGYISYIQIFGVITFAPEKTIALQGEPFQIGDIEFMGYSLNPPQAQPDETIQMTLCWRSLSSEKLPVPYIVAINVVDTEDTKFYRYESYPASGAYTDWQPERAFCERFDLISENRVEQGRTYLIRLDLIDPITLEPLPSIRETSIIGNLVVSGIPRTRPPVADFQGIYLLDYEVSYPNDNRVSLSLDWGTGDWVAQPVTLFVHLIQDGNLVGQLDSPLGVPVHPSQFWGQNVETIRTTHTLDIPDGDFQIYMGLYNTTTLERLNLTIPPNETALDNRLLITSGANE
ncbi:MAG: hypothetical protein Q9P44_20850, partial [Anaerolineae bacterium]|nr:hypothetical protein [Anaerolineae bacterium]